MLKKRKKKCYFTSTNERYSVIKIDIGFKSRWAHTSCFGDVEIFQNSFFILIHNSLPTYNKYSADNVAIPPLPDIINKYINLGK